MNDVDKSSRVVKTSLGHRLIKAIKRLLGGSSGANPKDKTNGKPGDDIYPMW